MPKKAVAKEAAKAPAGKGRGRKKVEEIVEEVVEEEVVETKPAAKRGRKKAEEKVEAPVATKATKGKKGKLDHLEGKRGRKAGVRNQVSAEYQESLETQFDEMNTCFDAFSYALTKFVEGGNKAQAMAARKTLQQFVKQAKEMRSTIQDAKVNMEQVSI